MLNRYLLAVLIFFAITSSAQAMMVATQNDLSNDTVGIPASVRGVVSERDFVLAHCNEFRYRGGQAIANIEAVHEILNQKLEVFEDFGISVSTADYAETAGSLRGIINEACSADSFTEAQNKVQVFKSEADRIKNNLNNLEAVLRSELTARIDAERDNIRATMENRVRAEVKEMEDEARQRLESQLKNEAETKKQEMINRIQTQVESELQAEYGGQENLDIAYLQRIGLERGKSRGATEAVGVEAGLRTKYEQLAEEEVDKLKEQAEKRAKEIEAEAIAEFSDFGDINAEIKLLADKKYQAEWVKYMEEALKARRDILRKSVSAYYDEARALINAESDLVEQADQSIRNRYGIRSTADLLAELNADEQAVLQELINITEIDEAKIQQFKLKFTSKWSDFRTKMDYLKARSATMVMEQIGRSLEISEAGSRGQVDVYLANTANAMQGRFDAAKKRDTMCANPNSSEPNNSLCQGCQSLNQLSELVNYGMQVFNQVSDCRAIIARYDGKMQSAQNGSLTLDEALSYKNEIKVCLDSLRDMRAPYLELRQTYEHHYDNAVKHCLN